MNNSQAFQGGYLRADILPWIPGSSAAEDGVRLFSWFFADAQFQRAWERIRGQTEYRRVRLRIDEAAPELHTISWELLRDLQTEQIVHTLAANQATPFSRYLAGNWSPGKAITKRPLRMLVVIANPDGLDDYNLTPIDVAQEKENIHMALRRLGPDQITVSFVDDEVSLPRLSARLRKGVDLLHLIAHGSFSQRRDTATLYLADEDNFVKTVLAD